MSSQGDNPESREARRTMLDAMASPAERKAMVIQWFAVGIIDADEASFWMSAFDLKHE